MLGDFNARVGSKVGEGDQWWSVRGPHGPPIEEMYGNYRALTC